MIGTERRRWVVIALVVLASLAAPAHARAQADPEDGSGEQARMMAQALFEEGRTLMAEEHYAEACPKFEESDRLDPAIGTKFWLADCYELIGRLAGAWILFVDVAAASRAAAQVPRAEAAQRRADTLKPRLTRLVIKVPRGAPGMVILRNGSPVRRPTWGIAAPVEAGEQVIEARADGYASWKRMVMAEGEGNTVTVTVPRLARLRKPAPKNAAPEDEPVSVRLVAGLAMGIIGLVAVSVGTAAGIVAIDKTNESEEFCPEPDACFDRGLSLREEARRAAAVSTVSFAIGGSAIVSGLILWLTSDDGSGSPTTTGAPRAGVGVGTVGLSIGGRW